MKDYYIDKKSALWTHTVNRIEQFHKQAKNDADFIRKMDNRMKKITKEEKLYYTIAALKHLGYDLVDFGKEAVEIYEGRIIADTLMGDFTDDSWPNSNW